MKKVRPMMIAAVFALVAGAQLPTTVFAVPDSMVDIPMLLPVPAVPTPVPAGTVEVTDPEENEELPRGLHEFNGIFVDATPSLVNSFAYRISSGACASEGGEVMSGMMFNTNGSLANTLSLASLDVGTYCFQIRVLSDQESETSVSDSVTFKIIIPTEISVQSPEGRVQGLVTFAAEVTEGTPALTEELDWSVYSGDCEEDQGVLMAGNVGDFENGFSYEDGQFSAIIDTSSWADGTYCFKINPHEAGSVADTVNAYAQFFVGLNTVSGQKYEDIDGDNRLNYEIDRLVADYPIIATNVETGEVRQTTTDEEGTYTLALPDGIWTISEGEKRGWSQIRAYPGFMLIDEGEDEGDVVPLTCTLFVGMRGEVRLDYGWSKGDACTFLNKQVPVQSSGSGTRVRTASNEPTPQVLGVATSTVARCDGMYLTSYLRAGQENPIDQVVRLQLFLNSLGYAVPVTGIFGPITTEAVRNFQTEYLTEVLRPWNITAGTGYVFKTTRATINNMVCPGSEVMPTI